MGDANESDGSTKHLRKINRSYALASSELTLRQWKEYLKSGFASAVTKSKYERHSPQVPEFPVTNMTWFEAVSYCNWLSQQEGIPKSQWCYQPHPIDGYAKGMKVKEKFWELTGYRLPTIAEWEFACRAGTTGQRNFGWSDDLLGEYAWYQGNSPEEGAAGSLEKTERLGVF